MPDAITSEYRLLHKPLIQKYSLGRNVIIGYELLGIIPLFVCGFLAPIKHLKSIGCLPDYFSLFFTPFLHLVLFSSAFDPKVFLVHK